MGTNADVRTHVSADASADIPSTMNHGPMRGLLFTGGDTVGYSLGVSEPTVQLAVVNHLRPGDVFYDVGANVGFSLCLPLNPSGQRAMSTASSHNRPCCLC